MFGQRRFWEHLIRDQTDFNCHVDCVHWNPVKRGWMRRVADWPHSSFHAFKRRGIYPEDGAGCETTLMDLGLRISKSDITI